MEVKPLAVDRSCAAAGCRAVTKAFRVAMGLSDANFGRAFGNASGVCPLVGVPAVALGRIGLLPAAETVVPSGVV